MYHFISGLPRSGSTLLAGLLRQNPTFHASITSPVGRIFTQVLQAMSADDNEAVTETFLTNQQRLELLWGVLDSYYVDVTNAVTFDNNRRWCANVAALAAVHPESKVICCLRDPRAIVDSFERLFQRHPLHLSVIHGGRANVTVYDRVSQIMSPHGVLGFALNGFRSAFYGPHRAMLHLISYDDLCRYPKDVMDELHDVLHHERFEYDFGHIEPIPGAAEFDLKVHTPGLHDLKSSIVYEQRQTILPPDVFRALPQPFWLPVKEVETEGR